MRSPRRSSAALSRCVESWAQDCWNRLIGNVFGTDLRFARCVESWAQDCWNRLIGNVFGTDLRFEECPSSVSGPCRWLTKVSGWIVDIADLVVADAVVVELKTVDRLAGS